MSIFLRPQKICQDCKHVWYPQDDSPLACPACGSPNIANEKLNLIATVLFYSTGMVVLGLMIISWQASEPPPAIEPFTDIADTLTKAEEQIEIPEVEEESMVEDAPARQPAPPKPIVKDIPEAPIKLVENPPPVELVVETPPILPPVEVPVPEVTPPPQNDLSKKLVAFNIWSISELRLRNVYTKLMNDGSLEAELRKKDYLQFVNNKTKKCGELNPVFVKSLNTAEKLVFKESDLTILECHSAENSLEIKKLE